MFNYYGLKGPSVKAFLTSPRHISDLKAVIFFLGMPLVLATFVITGSKGSRALTEEVFLLILFMAVLFLFACFAEEYVKFSLSVIVTTSALGLFAGLFYAVISFMGADYTMANVVLGLLLAIYSALVILMGLRSFKCHSHLTIN